MKLRIKTGNFHYLPRGRRCLFDYDYDFLPLLLFFVDAFVVIV